MEFGLKPKSGFQKAAFCAGLQNYASGKTTGQDATWLCPAFVASDTPGGMKV